MLPTVAPPRATKLPLRVGVTWERGDEAEVPPGAGGHASTLAAVVSTLPLATESATPRQLGESSAGDSSSLLIRSGAIGAWCGAWLIAHRVAEASSGFDDGLLGALLARADVAAVIALVAGVVVVATESVRRVLQGSEPVSWRTHLWRWLAPLYALWVPVVVVNLIVLDPPRTTRSLIATLVMFRGLDGAPMGGMGIGPVLTMFAMTVLLLPVVERLMRHGLSDASGAASLGTVVRWGVGLALVGLLVRTVVVVGGWTAPFGVVSWLPAHLDVVGAGMVIAALGVANRLRRGPRIVLGSLVVAALAVIAGALVLPRVVLVNGADLWIRDALYVVAAAAVALAATCWPSASGRSAPCLATVAPGLLLAGELAFVTIARQHTEAYAVRPFGVQLDAAGLPTWLWATLIAAAIGVLLTTVLLLPWRRAASVRWSADGYRLALAAVVSGGLLVRVVTWLVIAPTKTDGGDPFYYHVTANMLALGHGFLEPFNWLDSEKQIAAAVHGPLYPIVLSISSRFGGTTYVDHKFVTILIGTAIVLVTALVAERLGGRRAALIAGALAAVYPNLWLIDSLMFPEGLFALLTTSCVLVAYRWRDRASWRWAALLGALIGLAGLTRGEGLLLGVLLAAPWFLFHRQLAVAARWRQLIVAGAACLAVLAPWTIRNIDSFEVFVPLSTNSNELLMYANCDDVYAGRLLGFWSYACQERYRAEHGEPSGDEAQKAVFWRRVGTDYAREHIDEVPRVVAARVFRQWELFRPWQTVQFAAIENRDKDATAIGLGMYYALVASSIAGAVVLRRRGERLLPLLAQVVSVTLTAAYAYGTVRFRAPVEPVLCILAAVWFASLRWPVGRLADESTTDNGPTATAR